MCADVANPRIVTSSEIGCDADTLSTNNKVVWMRTHVMLAPQEQWHVVDAKVVVSIDQEAMEKIVSRSDLLERFCHRTKQRGEELWDHV